MRIRKALIAAASGLAVVAAATLPATTAGATQGVAAADVTIKLSVHPNSDVRSGDTLKVRSHNALAGRSYVCLFIMLTKSGNYGYTLTGSKTATASSDGTLRCNLTFQNYTVTDKGGHTRHCPLTRKDANHGWKCAVAASTTDQQSYGRAVFTAHASKG